MSDIKALTLTQKAWEEISHHAVETFAEECCGVILHNGGRCAAAEIFRTRCMPWMPRATPATPRSRMPWT